MDLMFDASLLWWIGVVEIPVFGGLLGWLARRLAEQSRGLSQAREEWGRRLLEHFAEQMGELSRFRLEVAGVYATQSALRDSERRVLTQLVRIEGKLDDLLLARSVAGVSPSRPEL